MIMITRGISRGSRNSSKNGGGGHGPRKGRSLGIFKLTSKKKLGQGGLNPPNPLDTPLGITLTFEGWEGWDPAEENVRSWS